MESTQVRSKVRGRSYTEREIQEQMTHICTSIQQCFSQAIDVEQERKRQKTEHGYVAVY